MLSGIWCSPEIEKTLEMGYEIVKVYEIYEYESVDDIFSSCVMYFVKFKQECSGFPVCCYDIDGNLIDESVDKFISDYLEHEGVLLHKALMCETNFRLCSIVKLILNVLWGR